MYDIYTFLNDLILEGGRFILIAACMVGGIFVGKKLRDRKDAKSANDNQ